MSALETMKEVLSLEAESLVSASQKIREEDTHRLTTFLRELYDNNDSLIFCGVGKSGLIGQKLAATFMSLGLKSYFLHPTEALHGDLGRVGKNDGIIFISKSGTTEEIMKLLPFLPIQKEKRLSLLGNINSAIGKECSLNFDCSVEKEACLNNQAPTTSTTLALAMGDALAVVFENEVGLSKEGFAKNHPGGLLGKSLRFQVSHLMTIASECPVLKMSHTLKDALVAMTKKPVGGLAVVDDDGVFLGLIVDGDIRRALANDNVDLTGSLEELVNKSPTIIDSSQLAMSGLQLMEQGKRAFSILPVVDDRLFKGFLRLHDLVKEGLK